MEDILKPIEHTRVSQEAVDQIIGLIKQREFLPGDRLPGERQLVKALGIGRSSVREALRSLEGMGVVESRPGLGTFIKEPVASFLSATLPNSLLVDRETLIKLFQLRQIVETGAAALAAVQATDEDLAQIRAAAERMEACFAVDDLDGMVEADIAFHHAILKATGNEILIQLIDNVADLLIRSRRTSLSVREGVHQTINGHRTLLAALENRAPEAARQAMRGHLEDVAAKMNSENASEFL